ncbi:hypothetical protein J559_3271, partial [Acinetobacter sp. 983759]
MANYTPPDGHQVNLNFKDLVTGSTDLNFGADDQNLASLDAVINTAFFAKFDAVTGSNDVLDAWIATGFNAEFNAVTGQFARLDVVVQTDFIAEFTATRIDQYCALNAVIQTGFKANLDALFDINFIRGVEHYLTAEYQRALPCLIASIISWAKPVLRAHHSAFYFEHSLGLSNQALLGFEKAALLYRSVQLQHEESTGLVSSADFVWQENK